LVITAARWVENNDALVISASFGSSSRTASISFSSASGASAWIWPISVLTARSASNPSGPQISVIRPNGDFWAATPAKHASPHPQS
jgi:hypothetical protein